MPFSKPQHLIPILHPEVSLEALEQLLTSEQIQLVMRLDGITSIRGLAHLLNRSLTDVNDEIQELVVQGVLQLFKRSSEGRLERVFWPPQPAAEEWLALPGLQDNPSPSPTDTEPEVYTISSMELPALEQRHKLSPLFATHQTPPPDLPQMSSPSGSDQAPPDNPKSPLFDTYQTPPSGPHPASPSGSHPIPPPPGPRQASPLPGQRQPSPSGSHLPPPAGQHQPSPSGSHLPPPGFRQPSPSGSHQPPPIGLRQSSASGSYQPPPAGAQQALRPGPRQTPAGAQQILRPGPHQLSPSGSHQAPPAGPRQSPPSGSRQVPLPGQRKPTVFDTWHELESASPAEEEDIFPESTVVSNFQYVEMMATDSTGQAPEDKAPEKPQTPPPLSNVAGQQKPSK